jgi:hypothetical protein
LHRTAQLEAGFPGHQIAMESLSGKRAGYSSIRANQPEIKTELRRNGQGKRVPPSRHQHDFDAGIMSVPQGSKIAVGNLKLRIEQRAVDIGSEKTDGGGLRASAVGLRWEWASGLGYRSFAIRVRIRHSFIVTHTEAHLGSPKPEA